MPQLAMELPLNACDAAQLQLELRDLAGLVPASAFRLGELAARVQVDPDGLTPLAAYLEFLGSVPTQRPARFVASLRECLRLMSVPTN